MCSLKGEGVLHITKNAVIAVRWNHSLYAGLACQVLSSLSLCRLESSNILETNNIFGYNPFRVKPVMKGNLILKNFYCPNLVMKLTADQHSCYLKLHCVSPSSWAEIILIICFLRSFTGTRLIYCTWGTQCMFNWGERWLLYREYPAIHTCSSMRCAVSWFQLFCRYCLIKTKNWKLIWWKLMTGMELVYWYPSYCLYTTFILKYFDNIVNQTLYYYIDLSCFHRHWTMNLQCTSAVVCNWVFLCETGKSH